MALKTLETGLARFAGAAAVDRARAYLYRAELAVRTDNRELARSSLAAAEALELTADERAAPAEEFAHTAEPVNRDYSSGRAR